jgi:hypothetical protein
LYKTNLREGLWLGLFFSTSSCSGELSQDFSNEVFAGYGVLSVVAVIFNSKPFGKVFLVLDEVTDFLKLVN